MSNTSAQRTLSHWRNKVRIDGFHTEDHLCNVPTWWESDVQRHAVKYADCKRSAVFT